MDSKGNCKLECCRSCNSELRTISAEDPIRYDFALCHLSMSGGNIKEIQKNFKKANLS
ncbi:DUF2400 family protein [bacterium]|nr:DUF2400 family protein [bacterium]